VSYSLAAVKVKVEHDATKEAFDAADVAGRAFDADAAPCLAEDEWMTAHANGFAWWVFSLGILGLCSPAVASGEGDKSAEDRARDEVAVLTSVTLAVRSADHPPGCIVLLGPDVPSEFAEGGWRKSWLPAPASMMAKLRRRFPKLQTIGESGCPDPLVVLGPLTWSTPSRAQIYVGDGADYPAICNVRKRTLGGWRTELPCQSSSF
jgi:hypothetical protein